MVKSTCFEVHSDSAEVKRFSYLPQLIPGWIVSIESIWNVVLSVLLFLKLHLPISFLIGIKGIWNFSILYVDMYVSLIYKEYKTAQWNEISSNVWNKAL